MRPHRHGAGRDLEHNCHTAEQGGGWPVAFAPDGRTLVGAARAGPLPRWDTVTGKELPAPGRRITTGRRAARWNIFTKFSPSSLLR